MLDRGLIETEGIVRRGGDCLSRPGLPVRCRIVA